MQTQVLIRLTPDEILTSLNQALLAEYQAVADYAAHARACERLQIQEALETLCEVEQDHAMQLAQRIMALGGTPIGGVREPQATGETLESWLALDLASEQWAIVEYARLVAGIYDDDETMELMGELLRDEIRHASWLKDSLRAIQQEA
jgi:bacterioferritin (cytochrome b1)